MSQQASTHLIVPEPSDDLIANEPWSIDTYADGLMDEIFADIDCILDGSGKLPSQMVQPEPTGYLDLQTVTVPPIVLQKTRSQTMQTVPQGKNKQQLSQVVVNNSGVSIRKSLRKSRFALLKVLSLGITFGLAVVGVISLLNSGLLNRLNYKLAQQTIQQPESQSQLQTQLPAKPDVGAELVNYMLSALAVIDRQEIKAEQKSAKPVLNAGALPTQTTLAYAPASNVSTANPAPPRNLPPVLAANNTPPVPGRSTSVVERIYIPVYQAPPPMRYAPPPIGGKIGTPRLVPPVPSTAKANVSQVSKPAPVKTALNTVRQAAKPVNVFAAVQPALKPIAVRTAPITLRQPPNPLPVLPVMPFRATPPKLPAATAPAQQTPPPPPAASQQAFMATSPVAPVAPAPTHTLEGLLELGSKSAALFKVDGVTRRVDVGEGIGSSGWTLVDISNAKAIVRRNGEVRSIFAGQAF
ncbi:MAG: hypothetical protein ACHBN1_19600 [Heteroscytonema crispum UTEX LB 1556]